MGMEFGSSTNPLFAVGTFGRARFDAGYDGHDPEPRRTASRRGIFRRPATRVSHGTRTAVFVQMYGDVVMDMKPQSKEDVDPFEEIIDAIKEERK